MPANVGRRAELPFPVRGTACRDAWQADDVAELAEIRRRLAAFDAATERIAAEWRRELARAHIREIFPNVSSLQVTRTDESKPRIRPIRRRWR